MTARTCVVTGAASGIGAATASYLREQGHWVIACDLHNADVTGDLATPEGRAAVIDGVRQLSGGQVDAIAANAGGGPPETQLALNFFGAVATLEGLRPLLGGSPAPRAVLVSSVSSLGPFDQGLIDACLRLDEIAAVAAQHDALAAGTEPLTLYGSAKHALNCWCRQIAVKPEWAGANIPLNAIAPGVIDTPAAAHILSSIENRAQMHRLVPLPAARPGRPRQVAAIIAWCLSTENALMTGQVLFVDGGLECLARGVRAW